MTYEVSVAEEQEWYACSLFTTNLEMLGGIFQNSEPKITLTFTYIAGVIILLQ